MNLNPFSYFSRKKDFALEQERKIRRIRLLFKDEFDKLNEFISDNENVTKKKDLRKEVFMFRNMFIDLFLYFMFPYNEELDVLDSFDTICNLIYVHFRENDNQVDESFLEEIKERFEQIHHIIIDNR